MVVMRRQTSGQGSTANAFNRSSSDKLYLDGADVKLDEKGCKIKQQNHRLSKGLTVLQYLVFFFVVINSWRTKGSLKATTSALTDLNIDHEHLGTMVLGTEKELSRAHQDFEALKQSFDTQKVIELGVQDKEGRKMVSDNVLGSHEAQTERIVTLQKHIQKLHEEELYKR